MKKLTLLTAVLALACGGGGSGGSSSSSDTTAHYAAPPAADSVVSKLPPDTLVNEQGQRCIVRPAPKFDAIQLGESYHSCNWQ